MKRLFAILSLIVGLTILSNDACAGGFLGIKKAVETVSFPLVCLDSSGMVYRKPDSIHVLTYADNATAASFTNRSSTWPFADISCDTIKIYGDTTVWFADQIQDIDGTGANFQLAIDVRTWIKNIPTDNIYTVQVINDSLVKDISTRTGKAAGDSTWGKAYTTSFTAGSMGDSLNNFSYVGGGTATFDSNVVYRQAARAIKDSTATVVTVSKASADSVWNKSFGTSFTVGSMGDSLNNFSYVGGGTATFDSNVVYRQAARAIKDSTATVVTVSKASADSVWNKSFGTSFTVGSMGDSANNSSWIQGITSAAKSAIAAAIWDLDTTGHNITGTFGYFNNGRNWATTGQMVDSIWNEDSTGHYTSPHMAYIASQTGAGASFTNANAAMVSDSVWNKAFNTAFGNGTMGDSLNNSSWVQGWSSADSTLFSRWIKRLVWGYVLGSGNDSVPYDARNVFPQGGYVSQAQTIATNGLTSGSLDATAASEISAAVWAEATRTLTAGGYSGLTSADSSAVNRWIQRGVWGIQKGSGADSSTTAQRVISSTGSVTITAGDIVSIAKSASDSVWRKSFASAGAQAGSIGDSLNNFSYVGGSGGGSGSGAFTVTIRIVDTSATPDSVLSNQVVTINNRAQNGQTYTAVTDNTGTALFNLDAGNYVRLTDAAGYAFKLDSFTVGGLRTDTLKLTKYGGDRKPISFRYDDPTGAPVRGFYASLQLIMVHDSLPRLQDTAMAANAGEVIRLSDLDNDGRVNGYLLQNSRITNDSSYYVATFYRKNGTKLRGPEKFRVSNGTTAIEYKDLTRWGI